MHQADSDLIVEMSSGVPKQSVPTLNIGFRELPSVSNVRTVEMPLIEKLQFFENIKNLHFLSLDQTKRRQCRRR